MKKLELDLWNRKEIYDLFSTVDYPFYSVTIPINVTNVKRISKAQGLSFYYLMIWACTKAMNTVEAFKIQIKEDELFVADRLYPSATCMKKGEETFAIVSAKWEEDYRLFCKNMAEALNCQTTLLSKGKIEGEPIYISSTPWFDFTSLTNERNFDKNDTIPRLAWGKYFEEKGQLMVHLSIDANHRTIDGLHIGQFKAELDAQIEALV